VCYFKPSMVTPDVNTDLIVLVVDDNRVIRELVTRQLAKLGVRSETAVDGNDAIAKLEAASYDIVLMDVQMPEMDGIAATQEVRRKEASLGKHTTIIALTGHGSRVECIEAGMDDYIAKPMNIATLRATLQKWAPNFNFAT
jgi:two-component system, sensor histidine kinase and response regulator